jgi:hypothetical protein
MIAQMHDSKTSAPAPPPPCMSPALGQPGTAPPTTRLPCKGRFAKSTRASSTCQQVGLMRDARARVPAPQFFPPMPSARQSRQGGARRWTDSRRWGGAPLPALATHTHTHTRTQTPCAPDRARGLRDQRRRRVAQAPGAPRRRAGRTTLFFTRSWTDLRGNTWQGGRSDYAHDACEQEGCGLPCRV